MKHYKLAKDEESMLDDFEKGTLIQVKDFVRERQKYQAYARATLAKAEKVKYSTGQLPDR